MSVVKLAVTAAQIAMVLKRGADEATIDHQIKGIEGMAKSLRDKITVVEAAIVVHAVKNKTSAKMNALISVLTAEKKAPEARAVIAWAERRGFKKEKHPVTGKMQLGYDEAKFIEMAEAIATDEVAFVTDMLASPFHLSIKKEDVYRDVNFLKDIERAIKRAKSAKAEYDKREAAEVATNIVGLDQVEKFLATLQ